MKKFYTWSFSVALAGFLFGFDTIVISGADQTLQGLWNSSDVFHGFVVMAMALWGTVVGAIGGGIPTNILGRKKTLIGIGVLFFISAIGSALADGPWLFAVFRFIGGLGIGVSTIAAPAYISEIAPADKRGRLVALYQLSIVLGILAAFLSNYLLSGIGANAWRWMVGIEVIPAFVYSVVVFFIPESPRWLVMKGKLKEAGNILKTIDPAADLKEVSNKLADVKEQISESVFMKKYRKPLLLVFFIAFFNQFSGINALLYYAPRIFEAAGLGGSTALLSSIGVGGVNVVFTLIGMSLIDKMGRKQLMYIGSLGYILSLGMVALSFFMEWGGLAVPVFLFVFIGAHAIGQGTVIWVFIAEIFPTHLRASGQAFGSGVHWVLAAIIPSLIPALFSGIGAASVFLFFALMMVGQLIWVKLFMPETKGISLEELTDKLSA